MTIFAQLTCCFLKSGPSEDSITPGRYPTTTTLFPGTPMDYGYALVALMDSFNWKSVAVIQDLATALVNSARVEGIMRGLFFALDNRATSIEQKIIRMDSTKDVKPSGYYNALWRAANHSQSKKENPMNTACVIKSIYCQLFHASYSNCLRNTPCRFAWAPGKRDSQQGWSASFSPRGPMPHCSILIHWCFRCIAHIEHFNQHWKESVMQ